MAELDFIDWLKQELAAKHPASLHLPIPAGDDAAALHLQSGRALFAADMLMDSVHFDLRSTPADLVGRKALAVNISDIAAMAGTPVAATVSLALPRHGGLAAGKELMRGLIDLARAYDVTVAGGDTNSWDGPLVVSVAIFGEEHKKGSLQRSGARPGDWIFVTGHLGGSLKGKHLTFSPRVREAKELHATMHLTSMIDLSDGLATDLRHILRASGVGGKLMRDEIPITPDVLKSAPTFTDALTSALGDGEDFELCFTVAPDDGDKLLRQGAIAGTLVTKIGEVIHKPEDLVWDSGIPVGKFGWQHRMT